MSHLAIDLHWARAEPEFKPGKYSAEHTVRYGDSYEVLVDAARIGAASPKTPTPNRRSPLPCPVAT